MYEHEGDQKARDYNDHLSGARDIQTGCQDQGGVLLTDQGMGKIERRVARL